MADAQAPRRALVTGLTGQDGSFLAELLLEKGYRVIGSSRRPAMDSLGSSEHLRGRVELIHGDLHEPESLVEAVASVRPHELYHLAAPSFVPWSWQHPAKTFAAIVESTATLLEVVRDQCKQTRVFVAASGAIFGDAPESPQRESTPCRPQTPYATAKLAAHQLVGLVRDHDGIFACSGILYNHESERRPAAFVSRKVTRAAAAIKLGLTEKVVLGDLRVMRDWSFAGDIMRGAWLALQSEQADDYIFSSGTPHSVAQLAETAFAHVGLEAARYVRVDPNLVRPRERVPQVGDSSRAYERLDWRPTLSFQQLIHRMVDADLEALITNRPV
ncbi:MAG: GDP-mannose 4,6-dehydratase [Solirubrobacterales bacterium]|nr:GDP-mannose 4,6-dehydratase [Solirubrobacterales bacterium]